MLRAEIALELEKFRVRRNGAGELLQHPTHLHRRRGDAGENEKHGQDDGGVDVEQHETDKDNH